MSETKKKFRHIAVNGKKSDDGTKYAEDLTNAMNTLVQDGYAIQLNELENFTLVIGVHIEERPAPTGTSTASVDVDVDLTPPRTLELIQRFRAFADSMPLESFVVEVKKQAPQLMRGFGAEELAEAASTIERMLTLHAQNHANAKDCPRERVMRVMAETIRATIQLQLQ